MINQALPRISQTQALHQKAHLARAPLAAQIGRNAACVQLAGNQGHRRAAPSLNFGEDRRQLRRIFCCRPCSTWSWVVFGVRKLSTLVLSFKPMVSTTE